MITLIGTSTTTIGFGLCGIKDIHEVSRRIDPTDLRKIIDSSENEFIMIDEDIYEKIKDQEINKNFIVVPFRFRKDLNTDDIDSLVQDTLGVKMRDKSERKDN